MPAARFIQRYRVRLLLAAVVVVTVVLSLGPQRARAQLPEPISSVYPAGSDAWRGVAVFVRFRAPMDTRSVEEAISMAPSVPGRFSWFDAYANVGFRPDEPLASGATYRVTIAPTIRDAQGTLLLDRPYTWTFQTSSQGESIQFNRYVPVQLLTPSGGRGVPVQPGFPRMTLAAAIYAVRPEQFAERYAKLQPYNATGIDVAGLSLVRAWQSPIDATDKAAEIFLPAGTPPDFYVLDVSHPAVGRAQTFVIYSDLALVAKRGRDETAAWVSLLPSGAPVVGATVATYDARGALVASAVTGPSGVARLPNGGAAFALATAGNRTTMVGLDTYWCSDRDYCGYWWDGRAQQPTPREFSAHIHTDRPIYRPGHVVHYKATVRRVEADGYGLVAEGTQVSLVVKDTAGNAIAKTTPRTDAFGSVAGDFALGDDVATGNWRIELAVGRQTFVLSFAVQEYVKPDYEVTVTTDRPFYVRDDRAQVEVAARYYFGQPAAGAEAVLRVFRGAYYWYSRTGNQVGEYRGVLDEDGGWRVTVPLPGDAASRQTYTFEAEVTDASRRPVVKEQSVPVHPASFALALRNTRYGVPKGQPIVLVASTIGHDGVPAPHRTVTVTVRRWARYGQETVRTEAVTTGADGLAEISLSSLEEAWYSLSASATDDTGRSVGASSYAWVYGSRPWYWSGDQLQVTADRDSYAAGDVARLLVRSPVTTTALVTVERENVYDEYVVGVQGATTIEIPIERDYAPGVSVKVHVWRPQDHPGNRAEARLLTGRTTLAVPATDRRLQVEVAPDAGTHGPGEQAGFTIRVRDAAGRPVRAQVSLAVVDKAVLALAADRSGDIWSAFWSSRSSTVTTFDSLVTSQWYANPEADHGRGYEGTPAPGTATAAAAPTQGAPSQQDAAPGEAAPRREFPDTAYWQADLVTDAQGEARVSFKLPDTLTTWQALARAVTATTDAGQGTAELLVTKAIIADPALPRFAVQGDRFALDVLARNYTPLTVDAACTLESPGLVQLDPGEKHLSRPFNETRFARWSVVAADIGELPVTARVDTAAGADAIELPLDVQPFSVPERFARSGSTTYAVAETVEIPYNAIPASSRIEVRLSPSIALGIVDGIAALIGYPYGCIEQTMSRMMPNAVIGRLVSELDIVAPDVVAKLPDMMDKGLQKIYGYQLSDGSWGWWHSEGSLYITAYVLHGLVMTREAGYEVDAGVMDRGLAALARQAQATSDERDRAYAAYVLAMSGRGDTSIATAVYAHRSELDAFGQAALAVALGKLGLESEAQIVVDELLASVTETGTTASWPLSHPADPNWRPYYWYSMASEEKSTAMALHALARLRPTSPIAAKAARWLMEHRGGWSGGWSSTQATSLAILALTDYIVASREYRASFDWQVDLDGVVVAQGRVESAGSATAIPVVLLSGNDLAPGPHTITLRKQGDGTLYYSLVGQLALYYGTFAPTTAEGEGLSLTRQYTPIAGRSDPGGWKVGDVINVRLTLRNDDLLRYVIVEDMLPAGFEALNESLGTESRRVPNQPEPYPWRYYGYERKEIHDERVVFFDNYVEPGTHTFDYAVRAVTPGEFAARPAEAYAMYRPEVWGRSASDFVAIATRDLAGLPLLAGDYDRNCRLTSFDAALVAADWPSGRSRDVNGDGRLDVADILTTGGRRGLSCGDLVPLPAGRAGALALDLVAPAEISSGDVFDVQVRITGAGNVAGYDLTIELPEDAFDVVGAVRGDALRAANSLSPVVQGSTVRFGGYDLVGADVAGTATIARLRLQARRAGEASLRVTRAQVVTDRGGEYDVTANGVVVSPSPWRPVGTLFVPWAGTTAPVN